MVKKAILLFTAAACFTSGTAMAQQTHCFTDEMRAREVARNPVGVATAEAQLKADIDAYIGKMNLPKLKVTAGDDDTAWKDKRVLHIPIVFHVIHNYGVAEYVSDETIYKALDEINELYRGENGDTSDVIATYAGNIPGTSIRYIARPNIQFHMARIDPYGNPTNGITRRRDFTTNSAGDHSKFDVWPRASYLNIWIVNSFDANHAGAAAYAYQPPSAQGLPWYDGPITYMLQPLNYDNTLGHEIGHSLSLDHPWGGTNNPEVTCGDDGVDDTPPTKGHKGNNCFNLNQIYDTECILTPASIGKQNINNAVKVTDNQTGTGIKFKTIEKVYIDQVSIYPADSGKAFTIALKHKTAGGSYVTVDSYSGVTNSNNAKQDVPVAFVAPIDTQTNAYSIEFSVNPLTYVDTGSARNVSTGTNPPGNYGTIPNILYFTEDITQNNKYGYFYNWVLRYGDYFKVYSPSIAKNLFNIDANGPVTIDYPDTVNAQNVMDYTYCSKMFTYLQGVRMRAALRSNVADRSNLIDTANLIATGVMNPNGTLAPKQDLPPVADFSVRINANTGYNFTCRGNLGLPITFINRSWNDTLSKIYWSFSNSATNPNPVSNNPAINSTTVSSKFDTPGWVTVQMIAESNAGRDTLITSDRVYIADENAIPAEGYFQEFNSGGDLDKYPIFNHFNNFTTWEVVNNAGFYDNTSIRYKQFDTRSTVPAILTGTPRGDWDDFYTPAFDLGSGGNQYLTFYTSGAFRTNNVLYMTDELEISYSNDCGLSWKTLKTLKGNEIGNNGVRINDWTPGGWWDWQGQNISLAGITTSKNRVFFRFRYKPGASPITLVGTGNNFYLDRINISKWTTDVNDIANKPAGVTLAPNPTTGSTYVIIKDAKSTSAQISVTDVTGKLVYTTEANLTSNISRIEIPANYISVKGMYMVSVTTGSQKQTEKLVVY